MTRSEFLNADAKPPVATKTDMAVSLAARAYQTEMYEKSVKENIVVVMDTGSGKTLVAALRIKHELSIMDPTKHIWFLTPTVALCHQQHQTLASQIPSISTRSLTSHDRVDAWRSQSLWDSALHNTPLVVATYAVLQNALSAGFVSISSIALLVFDEAHNCVGKSPGAKIMLDFYWQAKQAGKPVPRVLGMTASPTNKVGEAKLAKLEGTLDARCRSPKVQRESLMRCVNRPMMVMEGYTPRAGVSVRCRSIASARAVLGKLLGEWETAPQAVRYRTENTEASLAKLAKARETGGKGIMAVEQLRTFCERAESMQETLGVLGAEVYMAKAVGLFVGRPGFDQMLFQTWDFSSRVHLAGLLEGVEVDYDAQNRIPVPGTGLVSPKMDCLVRVLDQYHREAKSSSDRCIVFVTERATAVVLHHLLSRHPSISPRLRAGCVVGSSRHERGKRDLSDVHSPADQSDAIEKFRSGEINLMVATAVAEEGLDVSACNLVVCFDPPASAKSFIQRRGRARRAGSSYILLVDETKPEEQKDWKGIEAQLRAEYEKEDDEAARQGKVGARERTSHRTFVQPETGAVLDMENAKSLLQRFCAAAGTGGRHSRGVDKQLYFIFKEVPGAGVPQSAEPFMKAKVVLPACVSHRLRTTWSKGAWQSERNASKDAAFQAFMRLYAAGLVNNNLLPLKASNSDSLGEDMGALIEIREQFNPWMLISKAWRRDGAEAAQAYTVIAESDDGDSNSRLKFVMIIPAAGLDMIAPFRVSLGGVAWRVRIEARAPSTTSCASRPMIVRDKEKQQQLVLFKALADFSLLDKIIPHLLFKIEAHQVAQELQRRTFFNLPLPSSNAVSFIRSGITAPVRGEAEYGCLEFIGDATLKLLATVFLTTKYPLWPVGYLSPERARIISNSNLCRIALEREIDRFLLTKLFDESNTQPFATNTDDTRNTARRTLAHTVKALIGAGKQAGQYGTALSWTKALLPGSIELPSLEVGRLQLFDFASPSDIPLSEDLSLVEKLAGHTFRKRSLLVEALTHGSELPLCDEQQPEQHEHGCYDRLAFLGNAILESLVSDAIYSLTGQTNTTDPSDNQLAAMTHCRAAAVNRHYLGYLALSHHVSQDRTAVRESTWGGFTQEHYAVEFPLSRFLRHSSAEVATEMSATAKRFAALRGDIAQAIASGNSYPWLMMTQLQANGFHADMVESLVGAVFVDSGSLEECEALLERMGLLPYLRRMVTDKIDLVHPKERLNILAGTQGVRYEMTREEELKCEIFVGDRMVARVGGGAGGEEMQMEAAVEAIAKLSL